MTITTVTTRDLNQDVVCAKQGEILFGARMST